MAGFVFVDYNDSESTIGTQSTNRIAMQWYNDVDARTVLQHLLDQNASKRVEILGILRKIVKNNGGHLPFRNTSRFAVFEVLQKVLDDIRWEVRYQCLLLIGSVISQFGDELDSCMALIMPKIIANLGHENLNIRRATLQVLHVYIRFTNNLQWFQKTFIQYGLESSDYLTRKGCVMSISVLFTEDFSSENLCPLIESLAKHLVRGDAALFYPVFLAMQKLNELVGQSSFQTYLQRVDKEAADTYRRVLTKFYSNEFRVTPNHSTYLGNFTRNNDNRSSTTFNKSKKSLEYGIFEFSIVEKLNSEDWRVRVEGIENMKTIVKDMSDLSIFVSNVDAFLFLLAKLLDDSNFKVVILTLTFYELLIEKMRQKLKPNLRTVVSSLAKRLGDSKIVVREHTVHIVHKLMHHFPPTHVLAVLLEYKTHRNPRLREEIVNRVTAAVLTFPSYNFEFSSLCEVISPLLVDPKRRVRLAALECFAALAQAMGSSRMASLVSSVDAVELNYDGDGLMGAVQARLARRVLPRCTEDGTICYALTIPSSAGGSGRSLSPTGADMEWILAASGSSSSATPPPKSRKPFLDLKYSGPDSPSAKKKKDILSNKKQKNTEFENNGGTSNSSKCDDGIEENYTLPENKDANHSNFSYGTSASWPSRMTKNNKTTDSSYKEMYLNKLRQNALEKNITIGEKHNGQADKEHSMLLGNTILPNRMKGVPDDNNSRTINSRIPMLIDTTVSLRKPLEEESPILMRPTIARTSSAGRHKRISSSYSTERSSDDESDNTGNNTSVENDGGYRDEDQAFPKQHPSPSSKNNEIFSRRGRRVSPDPSAPLGGKPVLVRSPSLTRLKQLSYKSNHNSNHSATEENNSLATDEMGNGTAFSKPASETAITTHSSLIDEKEPNEVNAIGIAALEDSMKMPSSPSPPIWPSTEVTTLGSRESPADQAWPHPSDALPEVYGDNVNISISKITREKLLKRQQEVLKEAEERRIVRERTQNEQKQFLERTLYSEQEHQIENEVKQQESCSTKDEQGTRVSSPQEDNIEQDKDSSVESESVLYGVTSFPEGEKNEVIEDKDTSFCDTGTLKSLSRSSSLKTPGALRKSVITSQPVGSKGLSPATKHRLAASSLALFDDSHDNVSPYPNPEEALKKALKSMSSDSWTVKIEGMHTVTRLANYHPDVLQGQLHNVVVALLAEVKNLRSSVSRAAILTLGDLFFTQKKTMEMDLDAIIKTLLHKSGESVGFIRDDIEKAMRNMIEGVAPNKAALAIMAGGVSHRNGAVRKTTAQFLSLVVEMMGATKCLTGGKEVTERLLPAASQFVMDGSPLTRYYGRKIFHFLISHPAFDKMMLKYVQPSTIRNIKSILDSIKKKGVGDIPKEGVSARHHKSDLSRTGLLGRTM